MLTLFVVLCTCAAVYFSILICKENKKKSVVSPAESKHTVSKQASPSSKPEVEPTEQTPEPITLQEEDELPEENTKAVQDKKPVRSKANKTQNSKSARKRNMMDLKAILSDITTVSNESGVNTTERTDDNKQASVKPDNHDYDYPVTENLEMWASKPLPLSDLMHLKHFVNYLLRTDKNQKWTNEFTPLCYMAFSRNKERTYTMGELSNRILTRDILIRDAMKGISGNAVDHLCMQVIELHSLNGKETTVTDDQRIAIFREYIRRRELCKNGWNVLAYIEHSDGNGRPYHIHTLCRKEDKEESEQ